VKKFNKQLDVWVNYFTFLFRESLPKEARELMDRAFVCLPKTDRMIMLTASRAG
jgi:hypothetical protein